VDVATIEVYLDLRKDFGRIAQRFPVEAESFVRRNQVQNHLGDCLESGLEDGDSQLLLLTGLPGDGKSWLLEGVAEELRKAGHLVARHFCYLEPGDPGVQRRITTDVLWGNLIAELIDHAPTLRDRHQPIYAADLTSLERLLAHAVEVSSTGRVILIVDGLDHVARVRSDAPSLSQAETDIVEQLALLKLPPGVGVVAGSQPGPHLDPLRPMAYEIPLPEWSREDVAALAERRSLREALREAGLLVPSEWVARPQAENAAWDELVAALHKRSEGNPLYATYLCLDLLNLIREQL
jgi:AAA ATPase domain